MALHKSLLPAPKARNMKARCKREAPKARNMKARGKREAPKARNMKARGKREAQRNASPLVTRMILKRALKVRNTKPIIPLFQSCTDQGALTRGDDQSRLTLFGACPWLSYCAPWRWRYGSRRSYQGRRQSRLTLFGACPWLSYPAPLALALRIKALLPGATRLTFVRRFALAFILPAFGGTAMPAARNNNLPRNTQLKFFLDGFQV